MDGKKTAHITHIVYESWQEIFQIVITIREYRYYEMENK